MEFIAQDSRQYASLFAMRLLEAIERLDPFPMSGRIVPECAVLAIREIIHGNYRVIYRVGGMWLNCSQSSTGLARWTSRNCDEDADRALLTSADQGVTWKLAEGGDLTR